MTRLSVTRIVGGCALRVMQGAQWAERIVATSPQNDCGLHHRALALGNTGGLEYLMKDDLARVALGLMTASLALSEFRLKHLSFIRRCPPMLVHSEGNCVAWTCAHLREVADYFGNEGWGNSGHNRRTKEIDGITVAVVGFQSGALAGWLPAHRHNSFRCARLRFLQCQC